MKKICLISLTFIIVFSVTSCKKKATPEMIEKYETIMKQRELFYSYFSLEEYDKVLKESDGHSLSYYNSESIQKKYYSRDEIESLSSIDSEFYTYFFTDENNYDATIDFTKFLNSSKVKKYKYGIPDSITKTGEFLNMFSDHQNYHKNLIPGTEDWNLWMMQPINDYKLGLDTYVIDKKGKYNPKKEIYPITQTCPFCIYKDKVFKETGEIKEFENWEDLYIFNTPGEFWLRHKDWYLKSTDIKKDENFIKQRDTFLKEQNEKQNSENYKKIAAMKITSFDTIRQEINNNESTAKQKYDGKTLKIKAKIDSIKKDKVELLYGPYIFFPKEDLKKMKTGQYITFVGTMTFYEYSNSDYEPSDFKSWAQDMDNAFKDLDTITKDTESGGLGYSFDNCTLLSIEEVKEKESDEDYVTFF